MFEIRGREILFHRLPQKGGTIEPLITRTYRFDGTPYVFTEDPALDPRKHLESQGVEFYEGSSIAIDLPSLTVRAVNTQAMLDLMSIIWPLTEHPSPCDRTMLALKLWILGRPNRTRAPLPEVTVEGREPVIPGLEPLSGGRVEIR